MGIRSAPRTPGLTPKARCPKCERPLAMVASGQCVYCGLRLGPPSPRPAGADAGPVATRPDGRALAPELLGALDPALIRRPEGSRRWLGRILGIGLAALFVGAVVALTVRG